MSRRATRLRWRGDIVKAKVNRAAAEAIDELTLLAAEHAKGSHSWRSRSGQLEGEIVHEGAEHSGTQIVGKFGTTQRRGFYGLFFERRRPFLRPAADAVFPMLAKRIKRKTRLL